MQRKTTREQKDWVIQKKRRSRLGRLWIALGYVEKQLPLASSIFSIVDYSGPRTQQICLQGAIALFV